MSAYMEHEKFKRENKVVSTDYEVEEKRTAVEEDGETIYLNNDSPTETVTRAVEGKLAEDVRKRVKATPDAPVLITEEDTVYWLSELTAENYYRMTVKCNGIEKSFGHSAAWLNFDRLLVWLDENPETPIGDEVEG